MHKTTLFCLIAAITLISSLAACQSEGGPSPAEQGEAQVPTAEGSPIGTPLDPGIPTVAVEAIPDLWGKSAHADSFVVDSKGMNTTCALCHSPINYLPPPSSIPETCFVCKFEVQEPPPLYPEDTWKNIQCSVCHELKNNGDVIPEIAWLEFAIVNQYAEVASPTELCRKCHGSEPLEGHQPPVIMGGSHLEMGCTDCHDAHSTEATCSTSACHPNTLSADPPIAGHDLDHENVSCIACHDGDGLMVKPDETSGTWLTFVDVVNDGETSTVPYATHNIVKASACDRCHYSGNPWSLNTVP